MSAETPIALGACHTAGTSFTRASSLKAARTLETGYADLDALIGPMEAGQCYLFCGSGERPERFLDELVHRIIVRGCAAGKVAYMNNRNYYLEKTHLRADLLARHAKAEGIDPAEVFRRVYFSAAGSEGRQAKAAEALEGAMLREGAAVVIVHGLTAFMDCAEGNGARAARAGIGASLSRLWRASARMGAVMVVTAASKDGTWRSAPPLALSLSNVAVSLVEGSPMRALLLKHPGREAPATSRVAEGVTSRCEVMLEMGRTTPPFRQSYLDMLERLRKNYVGMLREALDREAFELLLREAWDREHAAMVNAEVPLVLDVMNLTANIHNRGKIEEMKKELERRGTAIAALEERVRRLEGRGAGGAEGGKGEA